MQNMNIGKIMENLQVKWNKKIKERKEKGNERIK